MYWSIVFCRPRRKNNAQMSRTPTTPAITIPAIVPFANLWDDAVTVAEGRATGEDEVVGADKLTVVDFATGSTSPVGIPPSDGKD